jgi:hypothetical protein
MSEDERRLAPLRQRIARTLRAAPDKLSARNVYIADLLQIARDKRWAIAGRAAPKNLAKHVIRHHLKTWVGKGIDELRDYALRVEGARAERRERLQQELEELRSQRDLLLDRMQDGADEVVAPSMALAGFSALDLSRFDELFSTNFLTGQALQDRRRLRMQAPTPLEAAAVAMAAGEAAEVGGEPGDIPRWAAVACRHRECFSDCALLVVSEDGSQSFYKLLYFSQQPYYIGVRRKSQKPLDLLAQGWPDPGCLVLVVRSRTVPRERLQPQSGNKWGRPALRERVQNA